jgi:hypothetical protein
MVEVTGSFGGNGYGVSGNVPNRPYAGGSAIGNGSGGGTAVAAAFKSDRGDSTFVDTLSGSTVATAAGGASGGGSRQGFQHGLAICIWGHGCQW